MCGPLFDCSLSKLLAKQLRSINSLNSGCFSSKTDQLSSALQLLMSSNRSVFSVGFFQILTPPTKQEHNHCLFKLLNSMNFLRISLFEGLSERLTHRFRWCPRASSASHWLVVSEENLLRESEVRKLRGTKDRSSKGSDSEEVWSNFSEVILNASVRLKWHLKINYQNTFHSASSIAVKFVLRSLLLKSLLLES